MLKTVIIFAAILLNVYTGSGQSRTIKVDGIKRKYIIYLPKRYDHHKAYPLIFNFHGGGMTAAEQMLYTGMNQTADHHNFIVVYPAGIKNDWNVGFDTSYQKGTDDTGFIKVLVDSLRKEFRIDQHAIFAAGLSRGGFFCHRLASEMATVFAGIVSVGGPLPDSVKHYNTGAEKVSVMQVQGDDDHVVSYTGEQGAYASGQATFEFWAEKNGMSNQSIKTRIVNVFKKDSTTVTIKEVKNQNVSVTLVTVHNGGHTWPGSDPFNIGYPLGKTSKDINMNEYIWQFFSKHKKP